MRQDRDLLYAEFFGHGRMRMGNQNFHRQFIERLEKLTWKLSM